MGFNSGFKGLIYILKMYGLKLYNKDSPGEEKDEWWSFADVVTNIWEFTKLSEWWSPECEWIYSLVLIS